MAEVKISTLTSAKPAQKSVWEAFADLSATGTIVLKSAGAEGEYIVTRKRAQESRSEVARSNPDPVMHIRQRKDVPEAKTYFTTSVTWAGVAPLYQEKFRVLAGFEGTVREVAETYFVARLTDLSNGSQVEEEAEFPFEEVPVGDRSLIRLGAMFYWYIGIEEKPYGQITRASLIRFKRLPSWESADIEAARLRAEFLRLSLGLDAKGSEPR